VSTWRRRPREGTIRGGGDAGGCGEGALLCAQTSQCGLVVRPTKGVDARWRFGRGGVESRVDGYAAAQSLGHAQ
jgi:hypothetical protein